MIRIAIMILETSHDFYFLHFAGQCLGIAVGTCNCAACIQLAQCKYDADCGGLKGACNNQKFCDCDKGFKYAGFRSVFDAMANICNVKECKQNTPSCFGLPCNLGICSCPIPS
ncbi:Chondroitin proteoglycan 3 [Dirofilaria immitis]|nr:Chondroitin proteoglycan 3 [Dirofilaria immitis]